jgi:hypothetical protein
MNHHCESCGMPIASGPYCKYCVDETGKLQDFDTRFERMVQWTLREDRGLSREQAEANALKHMARMPAWARHPKVVGA